MSPGRKEMQMLNDRATEKEKETERRDGTGAKEQTSR
jgi:hypothetical protein